MRHEPNRMASMEELKATGRRSVFAAADWIVSLSEIIDLKLTDDKIALLKASFAPLFMFNLAARTAQNNTKEEILCLSCCSYVPRILPAHFTETNHLANNLIGRIIDELVGPIRKMNLNEQEIVAFKAIVLLNPEAKGLSPGASRTVSQLRDRAQEALFQVIRGLHPTSTASSRFGNLLFLLPTLSTLTSVMSDNVQLANAFNVTRTGPMLAEIFGDFPCDADFLQDLDLSGDEGGRHGSSLSLHVDDQQSDHYISNYTDDYVAHYSGPVSEVGHEVGRHAVATHASNMTDDWTQTNEDDNGGGGGYMNGGSQSPIGSYVENEFDPFSAVSPAPLQIGCGQLFALINDIDPANGFHLL
uniref:NR LBD domain-containing protein n=1 Tax=Plectus sambesii TaxID=2011161 RepID=A0A914WE75_9BILA